MRLPTPVGAGDAAALAALHDRCFAKADVWSAESFRGTLAQPQASGWALRDDEERLQGFILTQLVVDEAEVLTLAVDPACQRQGIATRLLRHALGTLAGQGAVRLHLEVAEDNTAALALYQRTGFAQVGRRSGYYPSGRAAILLTRHLKPYC